MDDVINKWKDPNKDYLEAEFKVDIGSHHLSKLIGLDSVGNGFAEYYKELNNYLNYSRPIKNKI